VIEAAAGRALLILAGRVIVVAATGIAEAHGIDAFIIGATVVAVGTSVPELATAIISGIKGHEKSASAPAWAATSSMGLFIVGVALSTTPISITLREVGPALVLGLAGLALTFPPQSGRIERWRGLILLAVYCAFLFAVALSGPKTRQPGRPRHTAEARYGLVSDGAWRRGG
jgi:cation:H+ antiporter